MKSIIIGNRPDSKSSKMSSFGVGGMGFESRPDQISYTLPATRYQCKLKGVSSGAKPEREHRLLWHPEGY